MLPYLSGVWLLLHFGDSVHLGFLFSSRLPRWLRETQEGGDMGIYVYVQLIQFVIKQKLTHHCKAIILQQRCLKKKKLCFKNDFFHSFWELSKVNRKFSLPYFQKWEVFSKWAFFFLIVPIRIRDMNDIHVIEFYIFQKCSSPL